MERRHIKWLPILAAGIIFAYQYFTSERFVNPETGRASHVGMSTEQEAALGLQTYQQVLADAGIDCHTARAALPLCKAMQLDGV